MDPEVGASRSDLRDELADLRSEMRAGFDRIDARIDGLGGRIDRLDGRIDGLQATLIRIGGGVIVGLVGVIAAILARGI